MGVPISDPPAGCPSQLPLLPGTVTSAPQKAALSTTGHHPPQIGSAHSPTLSPEMKITNVIAGRMIRSGARDERNDPTRTAGTLPRMSDVVTENLTWPKASAPRAAASVSGTAWVRSVPNPAGLRQVLGTRTGGGRS